MHIRGQELMPPVLHEAERPEEVLGPSLRARHRSEVLSHKGYPSVAVRPRHMRDGLALLLKRQRSNPRLKACVYDVDVEFQYFTDSRAPLGGGGASHIRLSSALSPKKV